MHSTHKLAAITAHSYLHELGEHDIVDIRRLAGPADPCILLRRGDVAAFARWALSLGVERVFVGLDHDALVVHGTIPDPLLTLAVRVEVDPAQCRLAGLCGVVELSELAAMVGTRVTS